jgi:hypothetical protein
MSVLLFNRVVCSAHRVAIRQNCAQAVVYSPRTHFAIEPLTADNSRLAFAKVWPDGSTEFVREPVYSPRLEEPDQ